MTFVLPAELQRMTPTQRAGMIYADARAELGDRLWQAALGRSDEAATGDLAEVTSAPSRPSFAAIFEALKTAAKEIAEHSAPAPAPVDVLPRVLASSLTSATGFNPAALGPNRGHAAAIAAAAARTGLPAAALAATVDAEAAKAPNGAWNPLSRNPRSSAAGLGQFLSGTWEGEANRAGTWLNATARANHWLDGRGRVVPSARSALLAMRYEPRAAVEAIADYARFNLDRLQRAGVRVGEGVGQVAKAAYLSHHLGPGDAVKFLRGGLDGARATLLLGAQVGGGEASRRIAASGDASAAHREWLLGFVKSHIRPERFA